MRNTPVTSDAYLLQLLRDGHVDAEIAVRLGVATADVRTRIEALSRSAGVASRDELRAWIETLDRDPDDDGDMPGMATGGGQPETAVRRKRRAPAVVGTAASMAAAAVGLAGLVSLNSHPATPRLAERDGAAGGAIVAEASPAASGQLPATSSRQLRADVRPDGAVLARRANEAAALPAGTVLLVEVTDANGRTAALERVIAGADGGVSHEPVLAAPANGELTSVVAVPSGALLFAAVCDGGACDPGASANTAGDAWTTFYRSDDGGRSWVRDGERDGRWELAGIDDGAFVATRPDTGARLPPSADDLAGRRVIQWRERLAVVPDDDDALDGTRAALTLPLGAPGRLESAWGMATESAMTWTPELRPGSTYYTAIYGNAYANTIAVVESGAPIEVRGPLGPGCYAANASGEAVILSVADGSLAPIAGLAPGSRLVIAFPP